MDGTFHKLCADGNYPEAEAQLAGDPELVKLQDSDGRLPLHWACASSNFKLVELLLQVSDSINFDCINSVDNAKWSPLMIAISAAKSRQIVDLLLKNPHVDLEILNSSGASCLGIASSKSQTYAVEALLARKRCLVLIKDNQGQTALMRAAAVGALEIVKLLIESQAPINASDCMGWTALFYACAEAQADVALYLLGQGCDWQRTDTEGKTAFQMISHKQTKDAILAYKQA